jgi:hypothetical protein
MAFFPADQKLRIGGLAKMQAIAQLYYFWAAV